MGPLSANEELLVLVTLTRRLPPPPGQASLERRRRPLVAQLLAERGAEIAAAWAGRGLEGGAEAHGALGEALLAELRGRLGATGLLARMDERLISEAPEQMDLEGTPAGVRAGILRDLDRVHGLIGSEQHLLALLEPFLARRVSGPLELLDIASGHGRFPIALARLARRRGLPLRITATDISVELLELCRQNVARSGESVQVRRLDALRPDLPPRSVDLVICTNSLHHFGTRGLLGLLAAAPALCREGMVLMDPFRAASALLPATLLFGLWGRERASVSDAQQSIRRAWTAEELRLLAGLVPPLRGAEIGYAAPGWWSLRWRAQGASVPAAG